MGIRPWREIQKDFAPATIGAIMSSYFGGRAEVHIRRTIVPAIYCDFASMYPTVCTLMGLWRFVIAQGIVEEDTTAATQAFLDKVRLEDLQRPETWRRIDDARPRAAARRHFSSACPLRAETWRKPRLG